MREPLLLILAGVTPCLAILCWYDWRYRRLPNSLTLGLLAAALLFRVIAGGMPLLISGALGAAVCGLFLLIPFLLNGAGGGDLKMLVAAGSIIGVGQIGFFLLAMSVLGVLLGVIMVIGRKVDTSRTVHCLRCLFDWRYDRKKGRANLPPPSREQARIPYAVAIAGGVIFTLIWEIVFLC